MSNSLSNLPYTTEHKNSTKSILNDKLLASNKVAKKISKPSPTSLQISNEPISSKVPKENMHVKSFAEMTANSTLPNMNQAIVLNSLDGIKQIQYIIALNQITEASNIISASRISNNRFCIFLKSQQIVDDLINNHSAIFIDNIRVPIRKLINPSKRIILSNVYPAISNNIITDALVNLGVKITSPITALKAGFQLDKFAHITSFRRQLYINPDDFSKLPGSIAISSENTTYRIFITDGTVTCFLCKKTGHVSSTCKTVYSFSPEKMDTSNKHTAVTTNLDKNMTTNQFKTTHIDSPSSEDIATPIENSATNASAHLTAEKTLNDNETTDLSEATPNHIIQESMDPSNELPATPHAFILDPQGSQANYKRPAPESTCPSSPLSPKSPPMLMETEDTLTSKQTKIKDKAPKKAKIRSISSSSTGSTTDKLDEQLEIVSEIIHQNKHLSINSDTLRYVIENFSNKSINIHDLCKQAGTNAVDLHQLIEIIRPLLTDRSIKSKITKLYNLLFQSFPPSQN